MTPENLAAINDLRMRAVRAHELRILGDEAGYQSINPTLEEIVATLERLRADRSSKSAPSSAKAAASASAKRFTTIDINAMFS
jgi:hypothetical protein